MRIVKLNFVGNDIEFLGASLFVNLKKVFANLQELNDRNYLFLLQKRKVKDHTMSALLTRSHAIQNQIYKIVK